MKYFSFFNENQINLRIFWIKWHYHHTTIADLLFQVTSHSVETRKMFISIYENLQLQSHYHIKYNLLENCIFPLEVSSILPKYFTVFIGNNSHNISWIQPSVLFVSVSTHIHCAATLPFEFPLPKRCCVWGCFFWILCLFSCLMRSIPRLCYFLSVTKARNCGINKNLSLVPTA